MHNISITAVNAAIALFNASEENRASPAQIEAAVNGVMVDTEEKKAKKFTIAKIVPLLKKAGFTFITYRSGYSVTEYRAVSIPQPIELKQPAEKKVKKEVDPNAPKRGRGRPRNQPVSPVAEPVQQPQEETTVEIVEEPVVAIENAETTLDSQVAA